MKIVFSNSITDDYWDFSYLHDCSSTGQNIFNDRTFKIEWPNIPSAFDDVTFGKWSTLFPRPGTSLKDNFILEGRIFGVYDSTINCQDLEAKSGPNVRWNFVRRIPGSLQSGPNDEVAYADRYRIFYRRGSVDNQLASGSRGNQKYLDLLRRYADDTGCEGCYGWKWFGCFADWIQQVPEGFSCAKAVASNKDGCEEVYQPVDCSDLVVKVSSRQYEDSCSKKYTKRTCPTEFMDDQSLRNKKCHRMDEDGTYHGTEWEGNGIWVVSSSNVEDLTCCSNQSQCCEDCFYEPKLGM